MASNENQIACPSCGGKISLNDALFERQFKEKLAQEKKLLEKRIVEDVSHKKAMEMEDLRNQIAEKDQKLELSMKHELELMKRTRAIEEKEKSLELELEKKLDGERLRLQDEISKRLVEEQRFKIAEKDKQLDDMRKQIEEWKRKSELTSQQLQGEVLELELETTLKQLFPTDHIEPVAKGVHGGDIIQKVVSSSGQCIGTVIWETKRTKSWSEGWIDKLKTDQRAIAAEFAVIVSEALPKDSDGLHFRNGVWVCDVKTVAGLATALRFHLLQVTSAKAMVTGKDEKMEMLYHYLTSTQFTQRIQSLVETFCAMQDSLNSEKRAYQKMWSSREQQIAKLLLNTAAMYGSVQGIVGAALPKITAFELPESISSQ